MQVILTDAAVEKLQEHVGVGEQFVRLGVKPGGCSGMTYEARLDDTFDPDRDHPVYERGSLRIVAEKSALANLDGLRMDYSTDLVRPGFVMTNPNAKQSCGCGGSFKAKADCGGGTNRA